MEPFTVLTALAAPMNRVNVDTDAIIPKQYLRGATQEGLDAGLFHDWRYIDGDPSRPDPEFVLNRPRYRGARILIAGDNFGCGSSREHAPWALSAGGFRCIVSTSFADIFYNNCIKNGLLPAIVARNDLARLMDEAATRRGLELTVDLPRQTITAPASFRCRFEIGGPAKHSLETGLDDIAMTMGIEDRIEAFESASRAAFPWLR